MGVELEADLKPGGSINWVGTTPDGKRCVLAIYLCLDVDQAIAPPERKPVLSGRLRRQLLP